MPESPATPFSGIFVSYRRDDSSGHAGRLFDNLVNHFGNDRIFMDIDTIEPGEDFVTTIENAVGSCDILIAIIGRQWLSSTGRNTGRLDNPNDFVRLEIGTALRREIRVIPVLVQRASMPKPQDLPDDLAKLVRRNAVELTDQRWQTDVDQLIGVLERVLAKQEAIRLAAAAKQEEEEERRRQEIEEKRRVEVEKQRLLAEEAARLRDAEKRRREAEEIERRKVEERANQQGQETARLRAEEERAQANAEARRRTAEEAEARRLQAGQESERRRLEDNKHAEAERLRRAAADAEHQRAAEQTLHASREEKQTKPDSPTIPDLGRVAQLSDSRTVAGITEATLRESRSRRTMLFVIIAGVAVFAIVAVLAIAAFIWMKQTSETERQSANRNATPASTQQTGQTTSAPATTAIPQPPPGMVYVPGGEFMMGRNSNDPVEAPPHKVTVNPFFLDVYEVTCEEYKKFLDAHPDQVAPHDWVTRNYPAGSAHKPVTGVDWDHAHAYAAWSSKRLPTEEEWEFAARGADGRLYPWGKDWKPGLANTGKPAGGANDGASGMAEVGTNKGTSPYGAYDMIGNAWEWTASDLKAYPGGTLGSTLDSSGDLKVIRGGSWASPNDQATATFRRWYGARGEKQGYSYTGFRLVRDITHTSANH